MVGPDANVGSVVGWTAVGAEVVEVAVRNAFGCILGGLDGRFGYEPGNGRCGTLQVVGNADRCRCPAASIVDVVIGTRARLPSSDDARIVLRERGAGVVDDVPALGAQLLKHFVHISRRCMTTK